ncbi:MAG: phosphate/phosphite/phosphonate ABC transporter substrate-binding protein [Acidobacteriaceae bacterium]
MNTKLTLAAAGIVVAIAGVAAGLTFGARGVGPSAGALSLLNPHVARSDSDSPILWFGAPPRGDRVQSDALYKPIAALLSRATGLPVKYRYTSNWLTYQSRIAGGEDAIDLTGPHFVDWQIKNQGYTPVARLSGDLRYVVFAEGQNIPANMAALAGDSICTMAPPWLGALVLQTQFPNPARQPALVAQTSFQQILSSVRAGKCKAGIVPLNYYNSVVTGHDGMIWMSPRGLKNQGFTLAPRVAPDARQEIRAALLGPAGTDATKNLRHAMHAEGPLKPASASDYAGDQALLRGVWWFGGNLRTR